MRILHKLQDLSQNELAELTGIPQPTLSAIEHDRVNLGVERAKVLTCHRTLLVAHFARDRFSAIRHILADGTIETGEAADKRLLAQSGLGESELITSDRERLELAYARQGDKIAYERRGSSPMGE